MLMEFALVVLNSYNFFLIFSTISSLYKSHTSSSCSTSHIPGYKTLQKNRSMRGRGTTNSMGNLGGGVLILVKKGLTYTSLSTRSLSFIGPSPDYLAIAVKTKGASPILFIVAAKMSLLVSSLFGLFFKQIFPFFTFFITRSNLQIPLEFI